MTNLPPVPLTYFGNKEGTPMERPEPSMLAGISELAERYGVQPNTVAVWTQRHADFPEPLIQVGGRVRVWWVPDVDKWVESRGQ